MTTQIYRNTRFGRVRFLQGVVIAVGALIVVMTIAEPAVALLLLALSGAAVWGMEIYMRRYVTGVGYDHAGWLLTTLSTFGERTVRFDAAQARLGPQQYRNVRGAESCHYPLRIGAQTYILDSTPPQQFDLSVFRSYFPNDPD